MNFLQFFVWGSWLIALGGYMGRELHFEGGQIGAIFATMGIASLVMPGIIGIIADKWFNAERLYGLCHIAGAACLFYASTVTNYDQMYWAMLLNLLVYMPTLSLANTVSYNALEQYKCDLIKDFPPIRVWGTIGFICAMWAVDLTGFKNSSAQLYVGGASALLLGLYSFTLPACKPAKTEKKTLLSSFGLDAFVLFKRKKMAIFFLFSMLLGAALQITNTYGDLFLGSFASIPEFADSFGVKHSVILLSISQMSETLFILAIPFFLRHFGIKQVMLISMFAWVFRFGLFGFGDPGSGLWMLILSMIVYGMAFDFFNISGSLFVEQETSSSIRASAQGLFFMMTNGLGAIIGGYASGAVVDAFSVYADGKLVSREWPDIWFIFAAYALVIGILFALVFKYKHQRENKVELQVLNITNSQAQVGAFALLLGEVNGERQLPIIIGPAEAQATALYMKGVKTPRPLTHDLFMTIIGVLGASLLRVLIYKAKDGIFYSYIYLKKDEEIIRIDTRTSDAVGMAIRAECPILIYESILEQECLRISNEERRHPEESDEEAEDEKKRDLPRNVTSMSLEEALDQAIKDENYELAAKIRDRINSRNQNH